MKTLLIVIIVLVLVAAGVFAYRVTTAPSNGAPGQGQAQVACTMEAKLCPDGSYVGRTGPRCEFAACPGSIVTGSTTSTSTDGNGHSTTTSTTTKTVQIRY